MYVICKCKVQCRHSKGGQGNRSSASSAKVQSPRVKVQFHLDVLCRYLEAKHLALLGRKSKLSEPIILPQCSASPFHSLFFRGEST